MLIILRSSEKSTFIYNSGMKVELTEIQKIRHKNLRILIESLGDKGATKLADKLNRKSTQTSQFAGVKPSRGISEKMARKIESAFNLAMFSLDSTDDKSFESPNVIDHRRMKLALKHARIALTVMPSENDEDEQLVRLMLNLYSGDDIKTPRGPVGSEKEFMVAASLEARDIMQKVIGEPGVKMNDEEERSIYATVLNDIFNEYINSGKINSESKKLSPKVQN